MSRALRDCGLNVSHGKGNPQSDGAVSWTLAFWNKLGINHDTVLKGRRFSLVLHQVRMPLLQIASRGKLSAAPWLINFISRSTLIPRESNSKSPWREPLWHWITWNLWVERSADETYQLEQLSPEQVCNKAMPAIRKLRPDHPGCSCPLKSPPNNTNHRKETEVLTWPKLLEEDAPAAATAMCMAVGYGYDVSADDRQAAAAALATDLTHTQTTALPFGFPHEEAAWQSVCAVLKRNAEFFWHEVDQGARYSPFRIKTKTPSTRRHSRPKRKNFQDST